MIDIIVVGAGLSGLFASIVAATSGARVTLVATGYGGLSLSHGCIDVWAKSAPSRSLSRLKKSHPYRLAGKSSLDNAIKILEAIANDAGYPFSGSLSKNFLLPTAFGALHKTAIAPASLVGTRFDANKPVAIAGIDGLRDFLPGMLAKNLAQNGFSISDVVHLSLPGYAPRRDLYAPEIARLFENNTWLLETARQWKTRLLDVQQVGIPAILGIHRSHQVFEQFQDALGVSLFEIPTFPTSVPGLRLEILLRNHAVKSGVDIILGSSAMGRVDGRSKDRRVAGIVLQSAGGNRILASGNVILATGGVLHGGMIARQDGSIHETVFDLPVEYTPGRNHWIAASLFDEQPYALYGLPVNTRMQPLGVDGEPIYANLYAVGGIVAGSHRQLEGSRQGIDLATAYRAVEAALE